MTTRVNPLMRRGRTADKPFDDERTTITGRRSVLSRVTDVAYVPCGVSVTVRAPNGGGLMLPSARAERQLPMTTHEDPMTTHEDRRRP